MFVPGKFFKPIITNTLAYYKDMQITDNFFNIGLFAGILKLFTAVIFNVGIKMGCLSLESFPSVS